MNLGAENLLSELANYRDLCEKLGFDFAAHMIDIAIDDLCEKMPTKDPI